MRGLRVLATCAAMCAVAAAENVRVTWIGQSCFVIQTEGGPTVITDPPAASVGYTLPAQPADVVTVTHNHGDHNNTAGVRGTFALVDGRGIAGRSEIAAAGLPFVLIPGFHDNQNGAQRGPNTIIRWTQGGLRFAHFGDYGQDQLSEAQLADLDDVDVAFVPAGGFFTIDTAGAGRLLEQVRPRVAILMHWRTALGGPVQLAAFPAVVETFPAQFSVTHKPATVVLSRESLSDLPDGVAVWLMEVAADAVAVNAASYAGGAPVAPGSIVSLFGTFAGSQTRAAEAAPLPAQLGGTEVLAGGAGAPLYYVSPGQINFQVPAQLPPGQSIVEVRVAGQRLARGSLTVVRSAPGVFAVTNQDGSINGPERPARRGEVLQIYATGQGEVTPGVQDGAAAPLAPLAVTPQTPAVTMGGRFARVIFSGLAPGLVGVWQINAETPADVPAGSNVPLRVAHGSASHSVEIALQ